MAAKDEREQYNHHRGLAPLLRPTSPLRTGIFLAINLAGFVVVNAFWQYLATGRWLGFSLSTYQQNLTMALGEMFLHPLNILSYPWMVLVMGLLLAVVVFVPLVVAVLYKLPFAVFFAVIIAVIGHAPILALAVVVGCILAARTPLRSDMPFLATVLGMVPVGVYLYLFGFGESSSTAAMPLQRWVLNAPFLIGLVAAMLAAAVVLAMARLTMFRPGVVWPVLAVLLAGPMVIFYAKIGPDKLSFALIANRLAPGDAIFEEETLTDWTDRRLAHGLNTQTLRIRAQDDLHRRRQEIVENCRKFLAKYPQSSCGSSVMWIEAQCMSLQLDFQAIQVGLIKCTAAYPSEASEPVWRQLRRQYPSSPQAALAARRLCQLMLRRQKVREADELLNEATASLGRFLATETDRHKPRQSIIVGVFCPAVSVPKQRYYAEALFEMNRLLWLMKENNLLDDPPAAEALAALLKINPYEANYRDRLAEIAEIYAETNLGDNLALELAKSESDLYARAENLIKLAADERTDAAIEANYELGRLTMQTAQAPVLGLTPKLKAPDEYFRTVVAAPVNPWQHLAAESLARLKVQPNRRQ
ncbi:MAG: hypothetical protein SVT52_02110 [Planctomycetota bacterium]|nr:hypothetical protein [Planctomycetota bacterium]